MTCRECSEFLSDYLDGDLDVTISAVFEHHLTRCPNCVVYLEQFTATIRAGKLACSSETVEANQSLPEELVRAILEARRT